MLEYKKQNSLKLRPQRNMRFFFLFPDFVMSYENKPTPIKLTHDFYEIPAFLRNPMSFGQSVWEGSCILSDGKEVVSSNHLQKL